MQDSTDTDPTSGRARAHRKPNLLIGADDMKPNLLATLPARRADAAWGGQGPAAPATGGETVTISQVADKFGPTPRALRCYESKGPLPPGPGGRAPAYTQPDQR